MSVIQKIRCLVKQITCHGESAYTVILHPERPIPKFRSGQFLHLALDEYDPSGFWPESRVFSISNSPMQRDHLRITYSVRGRFTARMERELAEGGRVWVKLPYGDFFVDGNKDVVLLAGGTGITAFTAFLQGMPPDHLKAVHLAYGARTKELLVYRDIIQECQKIRSFLHVSYFIETCEGHDESINEAKRLEYTGRLSVDAIWPQIQNPRDTTFYISGPPVMVRDISRDLHNLGINPGSIKVDAWE